MRAWRASDTMLFTSPFRIESIDAQVLMVTALSQAGAQLDYFDASVSKWARILATCSSRERSLAPPSLSRMRAERSNDQTSETSSSNRGWIVRRSCADKSDSWHPLSSAILTAAPDK